ncbi:MAG: RlmE family RNA methyltransferase [Deltaproteobacteria bacterium]|nr:RlmE family RNA methyltransferase [Deltaproteobacteria bacterium]
MAKPTDRDAHYFRAKREGYVARSVYKLIEIDKRFKIFRSGAGVIDLGASPGSWATFASERVGAKGFVTAIDLNPIRARLPANVRCIEADVAAADDEEIRAWGFPVHTVISDMAPKTSGVRFADQARSLELAIAALRVAELTLEIGGNFIVKVFQSADADRFVRDLRAQFRDVKIVKPDASRAASWEVFVVATRFLGQEKRRGEKPQDTE